MRIISQDGKIDVPYEQVSIERKGTNIWCGYNATLERSCTGKLFADYSSEEKAEKVMEMLHERFNLFELQKVVTKDTNDSIMGLGTKTDISKFFNYCFKFPSDEEIEV